MGFQCLETKLQQKENSFPVLSNKVYYCPYKFPTPLTLLQTIFSVRSNTEMYKLLFNFLKIN